MPSSSDSGSEPPPTPPPSPPREFFRVRSPARPKTAADIRRDEVWESRRRNSLLRRGSSVTEEDVDELLGCLELGFGFDPDDIDPNLSNTLPALDLYCAVKRSISSESPTSSATSPSSVTESDSTSFLESSDAASTIERQASIIDPGDEPETVKNKMKLWAKVVAYVVRHR